VSERRRADDEIVDAATRSRRRRRRLIALAIYLALLATSTVVRARRPPPAVDPRVARVTVTPRGFDSPLPGDPEVATVTMAFDRRCPSDGAPRGTPVVLLHGSPGGRFDFQRLLGPLSRDRCAIAPDLPGFGDSTRALPDYSVAAHAAYVEALLDALHEPRAHVVGFSMGAGVAIELADRAPGRVASLTLLSGLGIQEQELFGRYGVNHAVHGLQLAALWALVELTPHFGAFDRMFLGVEYARNFYDTDQRPLRPALLRYQGPALVYHGRGDFLVPPAAAREHHRLLPQSTLVMAAGDHFDTFIRPESVAAAIVPFLAAADAGTAPTRAAASPDRQADALRPYDGPIGSPHMGPRLLLEILAVVTMVVIAVAVCWRRWRRRRRASPTMAAR
jgi:pimeloyl-ACP methyl ester carboxylesterase